MVNILILVETEFLNTLRSKESDGCIESAYKKFAEEAVNLLNNDSDCSDVIAILAFTEAELRYLQLPPTGAETLLVYREKALAFIRELMTGYMALHKVQIYPARSGSSKDTAKAFSSPLHWTGNVTDLTELIYALQATGCINNSTVTIKELSAWLYSFFNVDAKDCYRFYVDIRRRKTVSKTVFIERLRNALNEKLRKDDDKERARR